LWLALLCPASIVCLACFWPSGITPFLRREQVGQSGDFFSIVERITKLV